MAGAGCVLAWAAVAAPPTAFLPRAPRASLRWAPRADLSRRADRARLYGMARACLQQDAFDLLAFAVAGMAIAVLLNWRNDRCGYWLNAVLLAVADLPFIIFVLIPGLTPPWQGLAGPLLWAVAFGLTNIGRLGVAK